MLFDKKKEKKEEVKTEAVNLSDDMELSDDDLGIVSGGRNGVDPTTVKGASFHGFSTQQHMR